MMMLGRETNLPLDLTTVNVPQPITEGTDDAEELRYRLQAAHEWARAQLGVSVRQQKKGYD